MTVPESKLDEITTALDRLAHNYERMDYTKDEASARTIAEFRKLWDKLSREEPHGV